MAAPDPSRAQPDLSAEPTSTLPPAPLAPTAPDIRQYLGLILRRSWAIAVVFGVVFVGAVVYVSSLPSVYEATSKIVIVTPPGQRYVGSLGAESPPIGGAGVSLGTEARMVRSRLRAEKTVERLRKKAPNLNPKVTVDEVVTSLSTETIEPDEIRISARSEVPARAMEIANATAAICVEESVKDAAAELTNRREYIENLLQTLEGDLREAETRVAEFMREEGLLEQGSDLDGLVNEFAQRRAEQRTVTAQLAATRSYIATLQEKLTSLQPTEEIPTLLEDPLLKELRTRLTSLEVDLIQARARYQETNPKVLDLQDAIAEVKQRLLEHTPQPVEVHTTQPNPVYAQLRENLLEAELSVIQLSAQKSALDSEIAKTKVTLRDLPEKRQRLETLTRVAEGLGSRYAALLDKLQDARIDEAVQQGNVKIADLAGLPKRPVLPQRRKTLLFAILLGLAGGVGLAFLLDYLDTAVQTPEDVERHVGLTCLGFVPMTLEDSPGSIITVRKPKSPSSEAYRSLRSALKYVSLDRPLSTLCITSSGAGEGKSSTAANLAVVEAETGKRVIAVDTDLRRPSLHRQLEVDNEFGLTNVLAGDMPLERALQPSLVDGLLVLASGPLPPNPSELLESNRMTELVDELAAQCDLVVFDLPPILVVTDATVMASKTDGTLLVAETGKVSQEALRKCRDLIQSARGNLVGTILNKVRLTKATSYYYYYYYREYYYYGYYGDSSRRRRRGRPRGVVA